MNLMKRPGYATLRPVQGVPSEMLQIQTGVGADDPDSQPLVVDAYRSAPVILPIYLAEANAFIIAFGLDSRASFDEAKKILRVIRKAGRRGAPIAVVGMQRMHRRLAVMPQEATEQVAKWGVEFFTVQSAVSAQVTAPLIYLGNRHLRERNKPAWALRVDKVRRSRVWHPREWPSLPRCLRLRRKHKSEVWFD